MEDVVAYVFHGTWPSTPIKRRELKRKPVQLKIKDGWIAKDLIGSWNWHERKPGMSSCTWFGTGAYLPLFNISNLPVVYWTESCFEVKDGCIQF